MWKFVPGIVSGPETSKLLDICEDLELGRSEHHESPELDPLSTHCIPPSSPARSDRNAYEKLRNLDPLVSNALFESIPFAVAEILGVSVSEMFLFSDFFVSKPPRGSSACSGSTYGWHRDEDLQLGPWTTHKRPYVTVWIALSTMTSSNGTLIVDKESPTVLMPDCGDAVVFSSDLWHCSQKNLTDRPRRAFLAQYSLGGVMCVCCCPCTS